MVPPVVRLDFVRGGTTISGAAKLGNGGWWVEGGVEVAVDTCPSTETATPIACSIAGEMCAQEDLPT